MSLLSFRVVATLFVAAALVCGSSAGQTSGATTPKQDTDPVVHDLCGKSVALLGESPVHGFGRTLAFKVALVRRLVDECHYNALFIESPAYDFIHIQSELHSGRPVTDATISAAIGGLWANQEVQSLVPFLTSKAHAGVLTLGGLDDQLGRGTWALQAMPAQLVQSLPADDRSRCLSVLQKNTLWQYTADAPYSPSDKSQIVGCLDAIAASPKPVSPSAAEDRAMIASLQRNYARNFTEDDFNKPGQDVQWRNDRDRSMYLNFQWLFSRLPPHSKIIVWAATVHVASDLGSVSEWDGSVPFGSYIRHDFGDRSFALGFSAYAGSYVVIHPPVKPLSVAPPASLEGKTFATSHADTVYLSRKQLQSLGPIAARPLGTTFKTARWNEVLDGLVVFREEQPPTFPIQLEP